MAYNLVITSGGSLLNAGFPPFVVLADAVSAAKNIYNALKLNVDIYQNGIYIDGVDGFTMSEGEYTKSEYQAVGIGSDTIKDNFGDQAADNDYTLSVSSDGLAIVRPVDTPTGDYDPQARPPALYMFRNGEAVDFDEPHSYQRWLYGVAPNDNIEAQDEGDETPTLQTLVPADNFAYPPSVAFLGVSVPVTFGPGQINANYVRALTFGIASFDPKIPLNISQAFTLTAGIGIERCEDANNPDYKDADSEMRVYSPGEAPQNFSPFFEIDHNDNYQDAAGHYVKGGILTAARPFTPLPNDDGKSPGYFFRCLEVRYQRASRWVSTSVSGIGGVYSFLDIFTPPKAGLQGFRVRVQPGISQIPLYHPNMETDPTIDTSAHLPAQTAQFQPLLRSWSWVATAQFIGERLCNFDARRYYHFNDTVGHSVLLPGGQIIIVNGPAYSTVESYNLTPSSCAPSAINNQNVDPCMIDGFMTDTGPVGFQDGIMPLPPEFSGTRYFARLQYSYHEAEEYNGYYYVFSLTNVQVEGDRDISPLTYVVGDDGFLSGIDNAGNQLAEVHYNEALSRTGNRWVTKQELDPTYQPIGGGTPDDWTLIPVNDLAQVIAPPDIKSLSKTVEQQEPNWSRRLTSDGLTDDPNGVRNAAPPQHSINAAPPANFVSGPGLGGNYVYPSPGPETPRGAIVHAHTEIDARLDFHEWHTSITVTAVYVGRSKHGIEAEYRSKSIPSRIGFRDYNRAAMLANHLPLVPESCTEGAAPIQTGPPPVFAANVSVRYTGTIQVWCVREGDTLWDRIEAAILTPWTHKDAREVNLIDAPPLSLRLCFYGGSNTAPALGVNGSPLAPVPCPPGTLYVGSKDLQVPGTEIGAGGVVPVFAAGPYTLYLNTDESIDTQHGLDANVTPGPYDQNSAVTVGTIVQADGRTIHLFSSPVSKDVV